MALRTILVPARQLQSDYGRFAMATNMPVQTWTYEDLLRLPDDGKRYEIIGGELFEMPGPNWGHAIAIANLMRLVGAIVWPLDGLVLTAPLDVFFKGANPVQPDIVVLLADRLNLSRHYGIEGAPNILME